MAAALSIADFVKCINRRESAVSEQALYRLLRLFSKAGGFFAPSPPGSHPLRRTWVWVWLFSDGRGIQHIRVLRKGACL